jgi:hypothetical protein
MKKGDHDDLQEIPMAMSICHLQVRVGSGQPGCGQPSRDKALTQRYSTHLELAKEVNDLYELEGVAKSLLLQAQRNAQIQVGVLLNINS